MSVDERKYQRLAFEGTIFIELVSQGVAENQYCEVIICKTIDISHNGLRVGIDQELTVGAILQIGVELSEEENTLYLAGEVRWCKREDGEDGLWIVGFELLNANDSDIDFWWARTNELADLH